MTKKERETLETLLSSLIIFTNMDDIIIYHKIENFLNPILTKYFVKIYGIKCKEYDIRINFKKNENYIRMFRWDFSIGNNIKYDIFHGYHFTERDIEIVSMLLKDRKENAAFFKYVEDILSIVMKAEDEFTDMKRFYYTEAEKLLNPGMRIEKNTTVLKVNKCFVTILYEHTALRTYKESKKKETVINNIIRYYFNEITRKYKINKLL